MKKLLTICFLVTSIFVAKAQNRPVTINQLKELIGYSKSDVKKILLKKQFELAEIEDDNEDGFYHEYFADENYDNEVEIIYINKFSQGAGIEGITNEEYDKMVVWMKANNFYLKTKATGGTERNDIWEEKNEDWRLVVYYRSWPSFKVINVTLYQVK